MKINTNVSQENESGELIALKIKRSLSYYRYICCRWWVSVFYKLNNGLSCPKRNLHLMKDLLLTQRNQCNYL
jgi:hypothetical protein